MFQLNKSAVFLAAFLYLVLFLLVNAPGSLSIGTMYWGGARGDPGIYIWLLENNIRNVLTIPSQGFDAGFFYPFGSVLAFSDNFLLPSLFAKPVLHLTNNRALTYNLLLLAAAVLNGTLTYLLAFVVTKDRLAAFLSGLAFMFSPFFSSHYGHPQLQFAFFLPGVLYSTLRFCTYQRFIDAFFIGAWVVGALLTSVYYALFAYLLVGITLAGYTILRPHIIRKKFVIQLTIANAGWLVATVLISSPYRAVREAFGARPLAVSQNLSATLLSLVSAPKRNLLWGELTHELSNGESMAFLGVTVILVLLAGIGLTCKKLCQGSDYLWPHKTLLLLIGACALVTTSCHVYSLLSTNHEIVDAELIGFWCLVLLLFACLRFFKLKKPENELSLSEKVLLILLMSIVFLFASVGPRSLDQSLWLFSLLHAYAPGFDAVRVPGRMIIVSYLGISLLVGLSVSAFCTTCITENKKMLWGVYGFILMGVLAERLNVDVPRAIEHPPAKIYREVANHKGQGAILGLPLLEMKDVFHYSLRETEYMHAFLPTGRPTVNGYSGIIPEFQTTLRKKLKSFPDEESLSFLSQIVGLEYILVDAPFDPSLTKESLDEAGKRFPSLSLLSKDEHDIYLYRFHPMLVVENTVELLLPPGKESRELRLKLRLDYPKNNLDNIVPFRTTLEARTTGEKRKEKDKTFFEQRILFTDNEDIPLTLTVPPSQSRVLPQRIVLSLSPPPRERTVVMHDISHWEK